jgi:hypothetical protein
MVDAARWVLVEAWLSLGLRMRWGYAGSAELQVDEESGLRFWYAGHGEWNVERPRDGLRSAYPYNDVPQLGTYAMKHELAHYLAATPEQRERANFGLAQKDNADEERALESEAVIDAMLRGCSQVVSSLLAGGRR